MKSLQALWALGKKHTLHVWGKLDGEWKWIVAVNGEQVTISDWQLPSEIGTQRAVPVNQFSEFDLTV